MNVQRWVLTLGVAALLLVPARAQKLDIDLQRAIQKEIVSGDLKAAIDDYRRIADKAGSDKALAAQALLHLAACQQKLGSAEAAAVYQRLLVLGDPEAAVEAQVRLAAMRNASAGDAAGPSDRRLWTMSSDWNGANVSPDGRYLVHLVPEGTEQDPGGLFVHDFVTNADRRVISSRTQPAFISGQDATFSPDGKQIAYAWYEPGTPLQHRQLRVVSVDDGKVGSPRVLMSDPSIGLVVPHAWTPDGKWVSYCLGRWKEKSGDIGLVSVQDGNVRVLKTANQIRFCERPETMAVSPDGRYLAFELPSTDPRLFDIDVIEISSDREIPAVVDGKHDELVGWSPDGAQLLFASTRRGSRDLWGLPFNNGTPGRPVLVRSDLGQFDRVGLSTSGALYYAPQQRDLSYLKTTSIDFVNGRVIATSVDAAPDYLVGTNSPPVWSHDGRWLAYVSDRGGELFLAIRSASADQAIRDFPMKLWQIGDLTWSPDDRSLVIQASAVGDVTLNRGSYRIDAQTGEVASMAPAGYMFRQFSADGARVVFDDGLPGAAPEIRLIERDLLTSREQTIFRDQSGGFDRLVLSSDHQTVYFRHPVRMVDAPHDLIARNLATGKDTVLLRQRSLGPLYLSPGGRWIMSNDFEGSSFVVPTAGGEALDLGKDLEFLAWAPDGASVLVRQPTASLNEIWWIPLNGLERRKLDFGNGASTIRDFAVRPDGRVAFVQRDEASRRPREIWVLEHFLPTTGPKR